jgi:hypothetical protein
MLHFYIRHVLLHRTYQGFMRLRGQNSFVHIAVACESAVRLGQLALQKLLWSGRRYKSTVISSVQQPHIQISECAKIIHHHVIEYGLKRSTVTANRQNIAAWLRSSQRIGYESIRDTSTG